MSCKSRRGVRYLTLILRIFVLVSVVFAIANFSDIKKAKAASVCTTTDCTISETGFIDGGNSPVFHTGTISAPTSSLQIGGKVTIITGNTTIVTTYGSLTFSDLTITNGATVTQEKIAVIDIDTSKPLNDPDYLKASGDLKKVDLTVTGNLSLTNFGKIDVSGKGFPGGNSGHGYGPGGGCAQTYNNCGYSSTAAYVYPSFSGGGYGGSATSSSCSDGGAVYGIADTPNENGSGGGWFGGFLGVKLHAGYICLIPPSVGPAGGGIIKINANEMYLEQNTLTFISANGNSNTIGGGGGAGGSIWIAVNNLTTNPVSSGPPSVLGEITPAAGAVPSFSGSDGTVVPTGLTFGQYITANGGHRGGAGGRIKIGTAPVLPPTLTATLDTIPASGPTPLLTTLTATAGGTANAPTVNYTFWWSCNHPEATTFAAATAACGTHDAKFDGEPSSTKSTTHTYAAGTYYPKVIIERNTLSAQAMTTPSITVTAPPPGIQSKKVEVTVTWMEGTQQKTVKLYDILRSVVN